MADTTWLIDLDGVIWLAGVAIPGAAEAVAQLRERGDRVAFFTNNSFPRHDDLLAMLADVEIAWEGVDLLSSAQAAARCCARGERALVLGGGGIVEALEARGVEVTPAAKGATGSFDVVVAGIDTEFDYTRLANVMRAVRAGARLIGTNDDATYPTREGLFPGAGSVLAALACAAGVEPLVAGKPYAPAAELITSTLGKVTTVIGDRPSTDGALATRLSADFALVLSGVTAAGHGPVEPAPTYEAAGIAALVQALAPSAWRVAGEAGEG